MNILKKFFPYILLIGLSFFAFRPFLNTGFFPIHDDTQVTRVFEMAKALSNGMFPVRWSIDLGFGYGYPIFNFYAPFAYYVGAVSHLLGADALSATKIMMVIGILIAAFAMYVLAKEFFGKAAGLLAAVLFVYAPFHAVDIYVRGDVAEFFAYAFIPLVFYGVYKVSKDKSIKFILLTAAAFALVITSHNLTALMITPFVVIFGGLLSLRNRKVFLRLLASLILALSLSAFYWLPAILEMNYTNVISQIGGGANFRDHFVCIQQLWTSPWGYGGSAKGCIDGLSFMIGKSHVLLSLGVLLVIILSFFVKKLKTISEDKQNIFVILIFSVFALITVFLMLDVSRPIWELLKPMEYLQYPWRFLILTSFFLSFISAGAVWILGKLTKGNVFYAVTIFIILAVLFLNIKFFTPQVILEKTSSDYTNSSVIKWNISNISSEYMPKGFSKPNSIKDVANLSQVNNANVSLLSVAQKTQQIDFLLKASQRSLITIPLAYFPAWTAYIDGKPTQILENRRGISINMPQGIHRILILYSQTLIEIISDLISLAGLLALILGIIYSVRKYDKV